LSFGKYSNPVALYFKAPTRMDASICSPEWVRNFEEMVLCTQCLKWKSEVAVYFLKAKHEYTVKKMKKKDKRISAGMKFRNKYKFWYDIPAYFEHWMYRNVIQHEKKIVRRGRVVSTPLYSGGLGFKSRTPAILICSLFSSVRPGKCWESTLKFLTNPFQFIIHSSPFREPG
jgi:hypothetical protein